MFTVIIVNWNSGRQLGDCVASIHASALVKEVIVVDNASIDNSYQRLGQYCKVRLVHGGENLGFGKANNLAVQQAEGEFLLLLNPDAIASPSALDEVHRFLSAQENSRVGVLGVQLRDSNGAIHRSCACFPTGTAMVAHAIGIDRWVPSLGFVMSDWDHRSTRDVEHVIGAFYLIRRSLFESLGGFDERFFLYLEDLDLSLRVSRAGWRIVYLANTHAFHAGGGTSQQVKARRLFYALRSRLVYAHKHFTPFGLAVVLLATLCVEPWMRSIMAVYRGSWQNILETFSAYGQLMLWLHRWVARGETR